MPFAQSPRPGTPSSVAPFGAPVGSTSVDASPNRMADATCGRPGRATTCVDAPGHVAWSATRSAFAFARPAICAWSAITTCMHCFERMLRRAALPFRSHRKASIPKPRMVFALSLALGIVGATRSWSWSSTRGAAPRRGPRPPRPPGPARPGDSRASARIDLRSVGPGPPRLLSRAPARRPLARPGRPHRRRCWRAPSAGSSAPGRSRAASTSGLICQRAASGPRRMLEMDLWVTPERHRPARGGARPARPGGPARGRRRPRAHPARTDDEAAVRSRQAVAAVRRRMTTAAQASRDFEHGEPPPRTDDIPTAGHVPATADSASRARSPSSDSEERTHEKGNAHQRAAARGVPHRHPRGRRAARSCTSNGPATRATSATSTRAASSTSSRASRRRSSISASAATASCTSPTSSRPTTATWNGGAPRGRRTAAAAGGPRRRPSGTTAAATAAAPAPAAAASPTTSPSRDGARRPCGRPSRQPADARIARGSTLERSTLARRPTTSDAREPALDEPAGRGRDRRARRAEDRGRAGAASRADGVAAGDPGAAQRAKPKPPTAEQPSRSRRRSSPEPPRVEPPRAAARWTRPSTAPRDRSRAGRRRSRALSRRRPLVAGEHAAAESSLRRPARAGERRRRRTRTSGRGLPPSASRRTMTARSEPTRR